MKFDRFDDSSAGAALMPDGVNVCEITKVKEVVRKSDGCEVIVVTFSATDGDYEPVEKWLDPAEKRDHRAAMQLLAALGLPADADVDESIVGRRVLATTKVGKQKSTGLQKVYVNAFAAAEAAYEQADANEKPAAKPARKPAAAKTLGDDDIPF